MVVDMDIRRKNTGGTAGSETRGAEPWRLPESEFLMYDEEEDGESEFGGDETFEEDDEFGEDDEDFLDDEEQLEGEEEIDDDDDDDL
jgi:hypothetical protein